MMRVLPVLAAVLAMGFMAVPEARGSEGSITSLPVPAVTLLPGEIVRPSQITERKFRTTPRSLTGIATQVSEVTGKEIRRRLLAGRPIPLSALSKPMAVRRGSKVTVSYEEEGFSISTEAVALEDGATGDVIEARNAATGNVIRAEVLASGRLMVRAP